MSITEPDNNPKSPRQHSFGKIAAIFLIVGPPIFAPLFYLALALATRNGDTIYEKIYESFGMVFTRFGLVATYAIGFIPSLMATLIYDSNHRHRTVGQRLRLAALIGAVVNFLLWALVMLTVYNGHFGSDWPFAASVIGGAAGAGAVSVFLCALLLEMSN